MTAKGELFVDEDLRDLASDKINNAIANIYGKDTDWKLNANHYSEVWSAGNLPRKIYGNIIIELKNGQFRWVGVITANLIFIVEGDDSEKYIEPIIKDYKIEMFDKPKLWK